MRATTALLAAALAAPAGSARSGAVEGERGGNHLAGESSPYLLMHAGNPVDWYPWGEEALARARREDKPIFLSIGYSTCYWCHVMEREVFSDPAIAAQLRRGFVSIKVDREERPDLDEIYMMATQLLTGAGGWPNSVFLTPRLEPFFAGTYFPPRDERGRRGFPRVLAGIEKAWTDRRGEIEAQAARAAAAMRELMAAGESEGGGPPTRQLAAAAVAELRRRYDAERGGFGDGLKFPSVGSLWLLWEEGRQGDGEAARMVLDTLRRMGEGAIYDQLGGGFHRYTLDPAWRLPHFEKMLYDNALLAELLVETGAETGDAELERLARGTIRFLLDAMALPGGGFRSAIDAETDGVEGAYYTWTREQARAALGASDYELLAPIFGLADDPGLEGGRHTLYWTAPVAVHADRLGLSAAQLHARLRPALDRLLAERAGREHPLVDDKVLTDWNGMAIAAFARAGARFGEPRILERAVQTADLLLGLRDPQGVLLHVWRDGKARVPAFLDDYAFLIRGLLALDEATGEARWLAAAERLAGEAEARLGLPGGGYATAEGSDDLLVRARVATEGAVPAGNGVMLLDLLRLAERTGRIEYRERADAGLRALAGDLARFPASTATLASAVLRFEAVAAPPSPAPPSRLAAEVLSAYAVGAAGGGDGAWAPFELTLALRDGWHVNANPASLAFLVPTRVAGEVRSVVYPAGERLALSFAAEPIAVYSGEVVIRGESAAAGLALTYQACDDRRCLPPATRTVEIDLP